MEWFDRLSTGNEIIDRQHRRMMQCLDDLEVAVLQKRPLRLAYAVSQFREAVLEHLVTEEGMMRNSDYPGLEEHLAEHDLFRARMNILLQRSVQQDLPYNMVEETAFWLIHHFLYSDKGCIAHLAEHDARDKVPA